ncbi:hypothetical protein MBANPS3_011628 [Mucor bainieri]
MPPKKSNPKVSNEDATGTTTAAVDQENVVTLAAVVAPINDPIQDPTKVTAMEVEDTPTTITDAINGDLSDSLSSIMRNIHGDVLAMSDSTNAINGDAVDCSTTPMDGVSNGSTSTTLYQIPTPKEFAHPISSHARLTLMNEIERLKLRKFTTTIQSMGCP